MFGTIKIYIYGVIAAVLTAAVAIFKYRGAKIEKLEKAAKIMDTNVKVAKKVIKEERKVNTFEADNRVAAAKAEAKDVEEIEKTFYSI